MTCWRGRGHVLAWLVLLIWLSCGGAHGASLRNMTILHHSAVRLSDLFDDAGANAERELGSGPAPGGRIVVEAAQLAAIARQFGVDWRPASPGDRAVLERPGRMLPREDVLHAVKAALIASGASAECDVELSDFTAPIVPLDARPQSLASQLDYDANSGRFTAVLSITGEGMEPINLRLAGHADDTIELPVATTRLPAGAVLRDADVHVARVRIALLRSEVARAASDAVGMQLRRPAMPGQPFAAADLMRPAVVQRNQTVQMELRSGGLMVSAPGIALESGARGEIIHVRNPSSRTVIDAEVIAPGLVRISPPAAMPRELPAP